MTNGWYSKMNQRQRFILVGIGLLLLFFAISQTFFRQFPIQNLTIQKQDGTSAQFEVEIARSEYQRERGFMYRLYIPDNQGMLFVFPTEQNLQFWMKNTVTPLDMVYANRNGTIVGIVENAKPFDLTPRGVGHQARYVLELHGGVAAKNNLHAGDRIILPQ